MSYYDNLSMLFESSKQKMRQKKAYRAKAAKMGKPNGSSHDRDVIQSEIDKQNKPKEEPKRYPIAVANRSVATTGGRSSKGGYTQPEPLHPKKGKLPVSEKVLNKKLVAGTAAGAAAAIGGTALAAKKIFGKKSKMEKAKNIAKSSSKEIAKYAKEKWGKYKKLPNGEKIAVAAIPATVLAGGAAAIYAWWKKNHKK